MHGRPPAWQAAEYEAACDAYVAATLVNICQVHMRTRDHAAAIEYASRALRVTRSICDRVFLKDGVRSDDAEPS